MSLDQIAIRAAEPADAPGIAQVHDEAWRGAYRGIIPGLELERLVEKRGPDWWSRQIARRRNILVLEHHGKLAGYVTFGINRSRSLRVLGEVYELYIRPTHQGLSFGGKLFDAARDCLEAARLGHFVVWALEENDQAVGFYHAMGGEPVARGIEHFSGRDCCKVAFTWGGVAPMRDDTDRRSASS